MLLSELIMIKRLLLSILIGIFSLQQTYAMQSPTASFGTKLFKYTMVGFHSAALVMVSAAIFEITRREKQKLKAFSMPADDETKKFVQQTLQEYEFDQALINKLNIVSGLGMFSPTDRFAKLPDYSIIVPLDKSRLKIAQELNNIPKISWLKQQQLNEIRRDSINKNFTFEGAAGEEDYLSRQQLLDNCQLMPKQSIVPVLELQGKYIGKNSLNVWKEALAHEGGHAMQPDQSISTPIAMIMGMVTFRYGIYISTKLLHKFFLKNGFYKKIATSNKKNIMTGLGQVPATVLTLPGGSVGFVILGKYLEYDADSTALNRVKDPLVLMAAAKALQAHQELTDHQLAQRWPDLYTLCQKYPILYELLDVHQRGSKRAKRFLTRAEELEKLKKKN